MDWTRHQHEYFWDRAKAGSIKYRVDEVREEERREKREERREKREEELSAEFARRVRRPLGHL
jgi:hypothetical protein